MTRWFFFTVWSFVFGLFQSGGALADTVLCHKAVASVVVAT
jgi:hypothetical protein